jgi:hypothetical protein
LAPLIAPPYRPDIIARQQAIVSFYRKVILSKPFNIAAVVTAFYPRSHADVLLTRWLTPRPTDPQWGWNGPRTKLMSLYCAQFTEFEEKIGRPDMARKTAAEHHLPMFDTVRGALTMGGKELAADAVMLIGEHGEYPLNELGQKLYPRKELFDQIVQVFRETGRSVPVFCDKHLSWNFDWAKEMVETSRKMGFMLTAGSSIPHCRRQPSAPDLKGRKIKEAVDIHYGGLEAYGYHGIEYILSMLEQRAGGESGIKSITSYRGEEVWKAQEAGRWSKALVDAALGAVDPEDLTPGDIRQNTLKQPPAAYVVEHLDGLKVTHLNFQGHVKNWSAAFQLADGSKPLAAAAIGGGEETHFAHFATLARLVEDAFLTGKPPFPIERVLLSTGLTAALMKSLAQPGVTLATPELAIAYSPTECATVWPVA